MKRMLKILVATVGLGALAAGCGLKGDLERPAPLWGDPNREVSGDGFPGSNRGSSTNIVFTRDDVAVFEEDPEEEDLFAEEEEAEGEAMENGTDQE